MLIVSDVVLHYTVRKKGVFRVRTFVSFRAPVVRAPGSCTAHVTAVQLVSNWCSTQRSPPVIPMALFTMALTLVRQ